ncbi:MAG: hypothetical protein HZT41_01625 [Dechloromonas sp.]|jgi:hypothetical protein|nr:hypothetical protein [Thiobacillaceae bacterium]QLQ23745.1 MAG: hypothetical protein HZT41_01625 [Dechloromonas sp.]
MRYAGRPSALAAWVFAVLIALFLASFADAGRLGQKRSGEQAARAELAARLRLTDLALFTEARYTRHPSLADLHSAAQDHPLSLEHFPSGSLLPPPAHLRNHASLDRETTVPD